MPPYPSRPASRHTVRRLVYRLVLSSRSSVSFLVSFFVSSCGAFCDAARSVPRLVLRLVSSSRLMRLAVSSRGAGRSSCSVPRSSCYIVPARASLRLVRLVGRGGLAFASHVVGHPMPSRFLTRYARLRSSVRPFVRSSSWAWGVSGRLACGEIELTKTARFALYPFPPHPVREGGLICPCPWRGDGNRPRSNDSETRGRCRSARTLGLPYMPAGCFR